ncbi:MAG: hypothetical protein J5780_05295 [Treponema sp.]|nr:hypothetical protein [Treponema sp.]
MSVKTGEYSGDAWYTAAGKDDDVVLSSKVSLVRNLANFPFPSRLSPSEDEHIQAIVLDSFNRMDNAADFHTVKISSLDPNGFKIMCERGILCETDSRGALILRNDGRLSCTVNTGDHVVLSSFSSGSDMESVADFLSGIDSKLQESIQFAASCDFGYLNSSIFDSGSGMKLSFTFHLPCLTFSGKIPSLVRDVEADKLSLKGLFGAGGATVVSFSGGSGSSLGFYYTLETASSTGGSEMEQLLNIVSWAKRITDIERTERSDSAARMNAYMKNFIQRSTALSKASLFLSFREAVEIISAVKLGKDTGLLDGIENSALHALLYRIQDGHLGYVLKNGRFDFEKDVSSEAQRIQWLRSMTLRETFEGISSPGLSL